MDRYFGLSSTQRSGDADNVNADTTVVSGDADITSPFFDCKNNRDSEPQGWD